ncbi:hypothetical protein D9757_011727 [Collybiopsis confluens]|uniref:Uncharacterized protein n=1 Tax=Collybiopsis confluens TaxID=2823264 RepID=A0A8H5G8C9_9AGAR|nr:hypothetical protein D9757_011727 [Collybiopsis confluens]
MSARHLFELRIELKEQFERTQQAQLNERKTADSRYRLTSYVFHDEFAPSSFPWCLLTCIAQVRVPLNTALLALQNMSATGSIAKSLELEFNALEGSLNMMSKVNRLDSGKLESLSKVSVCFPPGHALHIPPLRLTTDARKFELIIDLDMNIDEVARRGAYRALGKDSESIETLLKEELFSGLSATERGNFGRTSFNSKPLQRTWCCSDSPFFSNSAAESCLLWAAARDIPTQNTYGLQLVAGGYDHRIGNPTSFSAKEHRYLALAKDIPSMKWAKQFQNEQKES